MDTPVKEYYNQLAPKYNADRFGNSYGRYIDRQEKATLSKLFDGHKPNKTLDMGCGTGRFLEFADFGIDISPEMLAVAREKYPQKQLFVESATHTHFADAVFQRITSFHMFMHLDRQTSAAVLDEAHRILQKGGQFVFDVPSRKRRRLTQYKAANWHGANDFTLHEIKEIAGEKWKIRQYYGVAFFPIHRVPAPFRGGLIGLDNLLCRSFLKTYASYLIFVLEKI